MSSDSKSTELVAPSVDVDQRRTTTFKSDFVASNNIQQTNNYALKEMSLFNEETGAFLTCLFCVFIDVMGQQFLSPVLVPYAQSLQASLTETGLLLTAEFIALFFSQFAMSWLADTYGRRPVIILSMAGSAFAYLVQGLAPLGCGTGSLYFDGHSNETASIGDSTKDCTYGWEVLLCGKILAGFFGGTFSCILAYIAELSMPDMELLKQRQTWVFSTRSVLPVAMGGIGGAIATFGLFIPFLVSCAMGCIGVCIVYMFLREARHVRARSLGGGSTHPSDADTTDADGNAISPDVGTKKSIRASPLPSASTALKKASEQNSLKSDNFVGADCVLLILACGFFFVGMGMVSVIIVYPLLFEDPSFGLSGSGSNGSPVDTEVLQGEVSKTVGLMNIPMGICNVFSMNVLYLPISQKLGSHGNVVCMLIGGLLLFPCMSCIGLCTKLWQVAITNGSAGIALGFFLGGLVNLPNSYIIKVFPHKIARARVVYLTGMLVGQMVGPIVISTIYEQTDGDGTCWVVIGACYACGAALTCGAGVVIKLRLAPIEKPDAPIEKPDYSWSSFGDLTPFQLEIAKKSGAIPVDEFFDSIFAEIRKKLESQHQERKIFLFSGRAQTALRKRFLRAIPNYPTVVGKNPGPHLYAFAKDLANLGCEKEVEELARVHCMPGLLTCIGTAYGQGLLDPYTISHHGVGIRKRQRNQGDGTTSDYPSNV